MRNFLLTLWYKWKEYQYERKCIKYFGAKPETIYVSQEAYDALREAINAPPDPKVVERFREILNKKALWDEEE
jgi:hypothetical protein